MIRICKCGHTESDHKRGNDCACGWTGEPDEIEECDCLLFDIESIFVEVGE